MTMPEGEDPAQLDLLAEDTNEGLEPGQPLPSQDPDWLPPDAVVGAW